MRWGNFKEGIDILDKYVDDDVKKGAKDTRKLALSIKKACMSLRKSFKEKKI